jgi:hypothetical protein
MVNMLHYDNARADAVGTTANTPETIGTITFLPTTTDCHLLIVQDCSTATRTTAEATSGTFNIDFKALMPQTLVVPSGIGEGGAGATNINALWNVGKYIPLKLKDKANFGGASVTGTYEVNTPEPTSDMAAQFTLAYSVGSINKHFLQNRGLAIAGALKTPTMWMDREEDDDAGTTVTSFTHPNAISVPYWVSRIHAHGVMVNNDAVATAGEHILGDNELTGTLQGLDPMKPPLPAQWATLGTAAASEIQFGELINPMYIECPSNDITITPKTNIQSATTGAFQVVTSLYGF